MRTWHRISRHLQTPFRSETASRFYRGECASMFGKVWLKASARASAVAAVVWKPVYRRA